MCQVVTYRRLQTKENSYTVSQKNGCSRLWEVVVYERFQYKALTDFWYFGKVVACEGLTVVLITSLYYNFLL